MNKKEVAAFFDRMAPEWDAEMIKSDEKINFILDAAGVKENSVVLDVALFIEWRTADITKLQTL